jgi:hypothetical protein
MNNIISFLNKKYIFLLIILFNVLTLPSIGIASRNASEVWTFDIDELLLIPNAQRILNLQYPKLIGGYGNSPYFFLFGLFFPLSFFFKATGVEITFFQATMALRIAQFVISGLGIYFIFLIGKKIHSDLLGNISSSLLFSSHSFWIWSLNLHPDIFQAIFLLGSYYFFLLYLESNKKNNFMFSAFFLGLSIGAKYWSLFFLPGIFIIEWMRNRKFLTAVEKSLYYYIVVFFVFFLFNLNWIFEFSDVLATYKTFTQKYNTRVGLFPFYMFTEKISNFTSPQFFGSFFIFIYFFSALYSIKKWDYRFLYITNSMLFFSIFYFILYSDPLNTTNGERYLLGFMYLTIVPTLFFLVQLKEMRFSKGYYIILMILIIAQILRVTGIKIQSVSLGQEDLFRKKSVDNFLTSLRYHYTKEQNPRFYMRDWITTNVPKGSSIYVESYMNLNIESENFDLPDYVINYDHNLSKKRFNNNYYNYAFTKNESVFNDLSNSSYENIKLGMMGFDHEKVFILKKKGIDSHENFYFNFARAKKINIYPLGPWKSLYPLNEDNMILSGTDTELEYDIYITKKDPLLSLELGYYPGAERWQVSDGFRMIVDYSFNYKSYIPIINEYILPDKPFLKKEISMNDILNKKAKVRFRVLNDPGKHNYGDWAVWKNPIIKYQ